MKKSEAAELLRGLMVAVQKYRSNAVESMGDSADTRRLLATVQKWIFGDANLLPALDKILNRYEATGELAPMDFYNMATIVDRFAPELNAALVILGHKEIPPPNMRNILGWDAE